MNALGPPITILILIRRGSPSPLQGHGCVSRGFARGQSNEAKVLNTLPFGIEIFI